MAVGETSSFVFAEEKNDIRVNEAVEEEETLSENFGKKISEETYYDDELECSVTEELYYMPSFKLYNTKSGTSGSGTYTKKKTKEWASGSKSTYYAQGYFTWGNGEVRVSSYAGNINNVPSGITISNRRIRVDKENYLIVKKSAYVKFSCTTTDVIGSQLNLSVMVRVCADGTVV